MTTGDARGMRVLIVEDDFMVARIHRQFVERMAGFTVIGEQRTGSEAIQAVERLQPDIVLLDIYLPDLDGLHVLEKVRQRPGTPVDVVVVTAARDADTVSTALRYGALHYLIKPFGFDDFRKRLQHVADTRRRLHRPDADQRALGQREVDEFFGPVATGAGNQLPKGLSEPTMRLVVSGMREQTGDESAAELGGRLGLSRVSARRYLEHLVATGKVRVDLRYGSAGRPERRYHWVRH